MKTEQQKKPGAFPCTDFPYPRTKVWVRINRKWRKGKVALATPVDCWEYDPIINARFVRVAVEGLRPSVPDHLKALKADLKQRGLFAKLDREMVKLAKTPRWPLYNIADISLR